MELKTYQQAVIHDLRSFLSYLSRTRNSVQAFREHWESKGVSVGFWGMQSYQDMLPGVPHICFKVPTGGGKTFLACHAVKPIFDAMPEAKTKVVVWLVPSDAIMEQTLGALKNPEHPYRQCLNLHFSGRVEVYTKDELLNGQNFNQSVVREQVSILVLSYDSFRGRKESLKSRQENSNLAPMAKALGAPITPLDDADESSLLQIINQLNPLVIVDESHHARSTLSLEMLQNFNPCFILELTATPTKNSNIISYVDAYQLKKENMVKLPLIVYNRSSVSEVIADAKDLRDHLEEYAAQAPEYIRPIVLFQAQPKGKEENITFEKIREKLTEYGIPREQIAIKTASINELKNSDLTDRASPIRYIITINALKEGWDCPFAYILASLANKTSRVDVEQIVGRVLRQPYTRRQLIPQLNMSYVLASSNDFMGALQEIVKGLNRAGFTKRDYRIAEEAPVEPPQSQEQLPLLHTAAEDKQTEKETEEAADESIPAPAPIPQEEKNSHVAEMLTQAEKQDKQFESEIRRQTDENAPNIPQEIMNGRPSYAMHPHFREQAQSIRLPQFFIKMPDSLFSTEDRGYSLLTEAHLLENFSLKGQPSQIVWQGIGSNLAQVDVKADAEGMPKVYQMNEADQIYYKKQFSQLSHEKKVELCKNLTYQYINKNNAIDARELLRYIDRILDDMDELQLNAIENSPTLFAEGVKCYIDNLIEEHIKESFYDMLNHGQITCKPNYRLPETISPLSSSGQFGRSLYEQEETGNHFEAELMMKLTGMENIKWWHRNISRHGFCLNAYINHYPDFIICTQGDNIILVETKGDDRDNSDSAAKLRLGRKWADKSGDCFHYFMAFQTKKLDMDGAYPLDEFIRILRKIS